MNLKRIFTITIVILLLIFVQSCNNDDEDNTARVQLKLIDSPGDYLEVNVNIIDVQYHSAEDEEGWKSFESFKGPVMVDLTKLIAGNSLLLTDEILPVGIMKQIRLVLGDGNNLLIEGIEGEGDIPADLTTPSAQQSGLKLNLDTELEAGFSYTFILDWDVQKSVVETGSDKYILKPVIRVNAEVNSGSIMGNVTGEVADDEIDGAVPLKDVIVSVYSIEGSIETYITESRTDLMGNFIIEGLSKGNYIIRIEQEGYANYETVVNPPENEAIEVTPGQVSNVGVIALVVEL